MSPLIYHSSDHSLQRLVFDQTIDDHDQKRLKVLALVQTPQHSKYRHHHVRLQDRRCANSFSSSSYARTRHTTSVRAMHSPVTKIQECEITSWLGRTRYAKADSRSANRGGQRVSRMLGWYTSKALLMLDSRTSAHEFSAMMVLAIFCRHGMFVQDETAIDR
jgi:hypothetical protein